MNSVDHTPASVLGTSTRSIATATAGNKVIRNTYLLLAMTLAFSALAAALSMALNLPHPGLIVTLAGYFGLLFLTAKFRDRAAGIGFVFALTGFMGYTLGPILNTYLALPNGPQIVLTAFAAHRRAVRGSLRIRARHSKKLELHGLVPDRWNPGRHSSRALVRCFWRFPAFRWRSPRCSCC